MRVAVRLCFDIDYRARCSLDFGSIFMTLPFYYPQFELCWNVLPLHQIVKDWCLVIWSCSYGPICDCQPVTLQFIALTIIRYSILLKVFFSSFQINEFGCSNHFQAFKIEHLARQTASGNIHERMSPPLELS